MLLKERRVIITGASSGMGEALVSVFSREGARIAALDISGPKQDDATGTVRYLHCDVSDSGHVHKAVTEAYHFLGGIDVLVNCAGIAPGAPAEEITEAQWEQVFAVNALGTYLTNNAVFPYMKTNGGRIINFGSNAGVRGYPGKAAYAASKGAALAWTRSIASEWGRYGITVNAIAPAIATPMYVKTRAGMTPEQLKLHEEEMARRIPLGGRLGDAETDFAPVLVFLAGEGSRFITGQTIAIDGGLLMVS